MVADCDAGRSPGDLMPDGRSPDDRSPGDRSPEDLLPGGLPSEGPFPGGPFPGGLSPRGRLAAALGIAESAIDPVPVAGRVHLHWHVRGGPEPGRVVRVPRLSHLGLSPRRNLIYATQAFRRMGPSGSVPRLRAILRVSPDLPWGALVADWIEGRTPVLPDDLPAIGRALASVHRLAVPPPARRAPLLDPDAPVAYLLSVVKAQIDRTREQMAPDLKALLLDELAGAQREAGGLVERPPPALTVADTHPGNFRMASDGRAILIDVERPVYDSPAVDLAHASLPTSLAWDPAVSGTADRQDVIGFHRAWAREVPPALAGAVRRCLLLYRRLIWLRTTSWACAWAARQGLGGVLAAPHLAADLQPSDPAAVALARRLARFIDPAMMEAARSQWRGADAFDPEELIP